MAWSFVLATADRNHARPFLRWPARRYCDGGSRLGAVADAVPVPGGGSVFFRGRATLDAMLSLLKAEHGLGASRALAGAGRVGPPHVAGDNSGGG